MQEARSHKLRKTGCYQAVSNAGSSIAQASTNRMLPGWQRCMQLDRTSFHKPEVTRLAAMHAARSEMLPQTRSYQVGSDACSSIGDASTNRMLPGWQGWKKLHRGCFWELDVTQLEGVKKHKPTLFTAARKCACLAQVHHLRRCRPQATLPHGGGLRCDLSGSDLCSCGQPTPENVHQRRAHEGACHQKREQQQRTK